jgi:hypothetical protein
VLDAVEAGSNGEENEEKTPKNFLCVGLKRSALWVEALTLEKLQIVEAKNFVQEMGA